LPIFLMSVLAYRQLDKGEYVGASLASLVALLILVPLLDIVLFKEMGFYGDRVTKSWHLFGSKTVYYQGAAVTEPQGYPGGWSSLRWIVQVRDDGRPLPLRLPLMYIAFFFPSDTAKKVARIMECLAGDTERNPRVFKNASLPAEVIGP